MEQQDFPSTPVGTILALPVPLVKGATVAFFSLLHFSLGHSFIYFFIIRGNTHHFIPSYAFFHI